uniref:Leucokinin-2 n=1 Tax=Rhyparobia maderae TaxID=36963 RepID=LCK2_RHYMA|nr:RecName: Full=Leucokinin-2; AltName: Full=Leucokinin II; Short=L-II [Rhyparobia maderae]prf//1301220B leucokinin II [Rhyparobia maderae]
DPGFSSWG